ncbi:MAG TPA: NAD(P)H-dependent oxidoreductase [Thermoanaerobaculia bacterium]|nr:NAD(P)H-dependent oxidoreductase [Thermoanaerobaculia bacterium]
MPLPLLQVVLVSTRQGRQGPPVARWFAEHARREGSLAVELVDLAEVGLSLFDEPGMPADGNYAHAHTRRWSETVNRADAFVFVTPEYNAFPAPSLVNALDHLYREWAHKAAGFVSYGGASGGMRAVQAVKPLLTTLQMMPIPQQVAIPSFRKAIGEDGAFRPTDAQARAADRLLAELARWTAALAPLRASEPTPAP